MHWFAVGTCQGAEQFGWLVGVATGVFAAAVIIILVAAAPRLGPSRPAGPARGFFLQHLLGLPLIVVWVAGGWYVGGWQGGEPAVCYVANLAIPVALLVGPVVLLAMFTAANQIGARSVR